MGGKLKALEFSLTFHVWYVERKHRWSNVDTFFFWTSEMLMLPQDAVLIWVQIKWFWSLGQAKSVRNGNKGIEILQCPKRAELWNIIFPIGGRSKRPLNYLAWEEVTVHREDTCFIGEPTYGERKKNPHYIQRRNLSCRGFFFLDIVHKLRTYTDAVQDTHAHTPQCISSPPTQKQTLRYMQCTSPRAYMCPTLFMAT